MIKYFFIFAPSNFKKKIMKTHPIFYVLALFALLFTACKKESKDLQVTPVTKEILNGYAQKGPLVNGAAITVSELNAKLNQTGKTYQTTISGNSGSFTLNNIELASNYVELKADGYYYNEISGTTSVGPITLYALSDIEDINAANVNVLTHLEKQRVEYLIKQQGKGFAAAKQQAQREVLAIFGFEPSNISSESLDLTADAKLLAVSCILQGYLSTGDMMQLMADLIADIRQDGKLNNTTLGSKLLGNAYAIQFSLSEIRNNLIKKYSELGINVTIPDFESYIVLFINSGLYSQTTFITYPATGVAGDNFLSDHVTEVKTQRGPVFDYCLKADLPEGLSLKIVLRGGFYGSWCYSSYPPPLNWTVSDLDYDPVTQTYTQVFTVKESGKPNEFALNAYDPVGENGQTQITDKSYITVEYYENGATTPTKTKTMKVISSY